MRMPKVHFTGGSILIVDDDPEVLRFTAGILSRQGYSVLLANSGDEAFRMYRERHGEIALLITDVVMPNTNGLALVQCLRELNSALKVMFMSGYKADHFDQYGDVLRRDSLLSKPFTPKELLESVERVLAVTEIVQGSAV